MERSNSDLFRFIKLPEVWIGVLTFGLRLWFLQILLESPFLVPIAGGNDRSLYHALAQKVGHGQIFPDGVFEYMPLYPWVLGTIYFFFGPNLYVAGFIGILLDTATSVLLVRLARSLGASVTFATIMGGLYAFYPTAIAYSVMTMPNTVNAFLLTLFTTLANNLNFKRNSDISSAALFLWFGLGIIGGVCGLGFAGMFLIAGLCTAYWLWQRIRQPAKFLQPFFFWVGFVLPFIPVTLHNWRVEHQFVLVTAHGGFNFYMGNHANATGYPVQIEGFRGDAGSLLVDARAEAEQLEGRKLTSAEFSEHWSKRAWSFIHTHPAEELKLIWKKFVKFWNRQEYDDMRLIPMFRLTGLAFASPVWPGFVWIGWFGLAGILLVRGNGLIKLIAIGGIAGVLSFFVTARYRLTFASLLCVFGALALETFRQQIRSRLSAFKKTGLFAKLWACFAVFGLAGLIVWYPLAGSDFRALDHYNTAAHLLEQKQYPEALELAGRGLAIAPNEPQLYFLTGNALYHLKKYHEAVSAYERVIQLQPSHASAHYNLGQTWMELAEPANTLKEAELALRYDPQHPGARSLIKQADERLNQKK